MFNIHNFIPHSWNMEPKRRAVFNFVVPINFFKTQPASCRKAKFHLVSIAKGFFTADDGCIVYVFETTDTRQGFIYLSLFVSQLRFVRHMLPAATTTNAKMITNSFNSVWAGLNDVGYLAFKVAASFLLNRNAYNITWDGTFYKYHLAIWCTTHTFAFLGNAVYG